MKIIFTLIFLAFGLVASAATYYVATNGNNSNPGTIDLPWASWQKGFSTLLPGDILYIRGGNYTIMYGTGHGVSISNRDGSAGNLITVLNYPGEKPELDCSSLSVSAGVNYGISMRYCDYWHVKGLTVKNVREYNNLHKSVAGSAPTSAWELSDCTNVTLELCVVTGCAEGFTLNNVLYNIHYLNCDAYNNWDYYDNGGLTNGFGGHCDGASTIVYTGCRAWANSDDGWDNMAGAGYMTYYNCWAYRNGYDTPTRGNGDGFKLGMDASKTELPGSQRTLYNCISAENWLMGFDESMNAVTSMDMELYNCVAYKNNRDYGFRFKELTGTGVTTLRNNISYFNNVNYQGRARNISDHNTWDVGAPLVSNSDFVNIDPSQLIRPRKADGSLPDIEFMHLATTSDLINAGVDVGRPFSGSAPDLGAFETIVNSVSEGFDKSTISIYPNPASNYVDISKLENNVGVQSVKIYDMTGALVSETILNPDINNRIPLNFKPGLFILQVKVGSEIISVQKLVVVE